MTVSNECFIYAVGSGETLHSSLISLGALSQSYNSAGNRFNPDWSSGGPTIYLSLLAGNMPKQPVGGANGGTWKYNGTTLTFLNGQCTTEGFEGKFILTSHSVPVPNSNQTVSMPALLIIDNLATGGNLDIDTISWVGQGELNGVNHDIDLSLPVRLSEWNGSGYLGQIVFTDSSGTENGVSVITTANGKVYAKAKLYAETELAQSTSGSPGAYRCVWKLNGQTIGTDVYRVEVSQQQVTDHAILECLFYDWADTAHNKRIATASEGIDDQQDPEFMYRNHEVKKGNSWGSELRGGVCYFYKDQKVRFVSWMGTMTDESVDDTWSFSARYCGINGATLAAPTEQVAGIASLAGLTGSGGYYPMTKDGTSKKWRTPEVSWDEACAQGMNISVFIKASKQA